MMGEFGRHPEELRRMDTWGRAPDADETLIVLRRHGDYQKDQRAERPGSIKTEWKVMFEKESEDQLRKLIESVPADERSNLDFLSMASPTEVFGGQRSMETAQIELRSLEKLMEEYGIPQVNLLNTHDRIRTDVASDRTREQKPEGAQPRSTPSFEHPRMLQESRQFVEFLFDKVLPLEQGQTMSLDEKIDLLYSDKKIAQQFWQIFEEDVYKEDRISMGAEGPKEMADRFAHAVDVVARFARKHHARFPGRRLVVLGASHYDTLSVFVKNHVANMDQKQYLPVEFGGGIAINIDKEGEATTKLAGINYPISLQESGSRI